MTGLLPLLPGVLTLFGAFAFTVFSVWLSVLDLMVKRLPNRLLAWASVTTLGPVFLACALRVPAEPEEAVARLWHMVGGAVALFGVFLALFVLVPGSIGGADVKLGPLVGGVLGFSGEVWTVVTGVGAACLIAAIWGVIVWGVTRTHQKIPFAPSLFVAVWIVYAFTPKLWALLG